VILVVAVVSGACTFGAAYLALAANRDARVRRRLAPHLPAGLASGAQERGTRAAGRRLVERTEDRFADGRLWRRLELLRRRSGVARPTAELVYLLAGVTAAVMLLLALAHASAGLILFVPVLAVGGALLFLEVLARRRVNAFEDQLPEVLDTLAAALKVGHSLQESIRATAAEASEPAASEFASVLAELRLGRPLEAALDDMADRMSSEDFRFVLTSITIQRQVGGSLADLLQTVAQTIRRRQGFARKLKALTAMGRISAQILVALPFGVAFMLTLVNRSYMRPLLTTSTGRLLVVVALGMLACGSVILKRMVSVRG
jgi:tight adherence protein B